MSEVVVKQGTKIEQQYDGVDINALGQPVGTVVAEWQAPSFPPHTSMSGRYCRLEPLDVDNHAASLFAANQEDVDGRGWSYLPYGPFSCEDDYRNWLLSMCRADDPQLYAIVDLQNNRALGLAAYLRIMPEAGSIEVGHLCFSPLLQCRPAATEAMYLMMKRAFTLGYRRYEWKCNSFNQASCNAAQRLGFSFEGIFRQAAVVKGRNRDTSWFSVLHSEWPALQGAFESWLDEENFDAQGQQRRRLSELTRQALADR